MSDLISRKEVLDEIRKIECEPGYQHVGEDWSVGLIIAENIVESAESIESTPSAEPERMTGHWIDTDNYYQRWKCSECGCHTRDAEPNYCPHCGTKME